MRTTLDMPDDLMRSVKARAAQTDRTLTEVITTLLRSALATDESVTSGAKARVELPLVLNSRTAAPEDSSPERLADLLIAADVADLPDTSDE